MMECCPYHKNLPCTKKDRLAESRRQIRNSLSAEKNTLISVDGGCSLLLNGCSIICKTFNPDDEFSLEQKAKLNLSVRNIKNACIAEICCPYDSGVCYKKVQRLVNRQVVAEYIAQKHVGHVCFPNNNIMDACCFGYTNCLRYRQWKQKSKKHGR